MCGRYVLFSSTETLLPALSARLGEEVTALPGTWLRPSWNIAPTHRTAVVRRFRGTLVLGPAVWGFPAPWKPGTVLFNARGESAFDKASFRDAEPALVVMDGWYEWHRADRADGAKTPYAVTGDGPLLVAGLVTVDPDRELRSTVVTSASAAPVEWLHDRMPRLLSGAEATAWLGGGADTGSDGSGRAAVRRDLASRIPPEEVRATLRTRAADRRVGNVAVNGPELLGAVPEPPRDTMGE